MTDISNEVLRIEIAAILKDANFASTSVKMVRLELEEKLDCSLESRRKEIDDLVVEFVRSKDEKKSKENYFDGYSFEEQYEEDEEVLRSLFWNGIQLTTCFNEPNENAQDTSHIGKEDLRIEIAAILQDADFAVTTVKAVRLELEEKLNCSLESRRKEIDDLVMEFVRSKDKKTSKENYCDQDDFEKQGVL